jgi:hypothetical protein
MSKCRIRVFQADWDPVEIYFGGDKIISVPPQPRSMLH